MAPTSEDEAPLHPLLSRVRGPEDLKSLGPEQRAQLAGEIRDRICRVVSKNGGHFGSNMGVVELTIGLHTVFDFPERDKLVWDVSHQCYPHKLLTGRYAEFDTLRQYAGISGFCHKGESPHDTAYAGHAGTASSIALGIAKGSALHGLAARHVVAVVGDASIASGMTLEALNHAGWLKPSRFLVILNDNEMSIARPVGGLHHYLNRVRMAPLYNEVKRDLEAIMDRIPVVGRRVHEGLHQILEGVKAGLIPGHFFEDLGLKYYGPIDGHDVETLIHALSDVKDQERPVLLHVLTKKGAGWAPALEDPWKWHAPAKGFYEKHVGEKKEKPEEPGKTAGTAAAPEAARPRWTAAFADALIAIAREDPLVVALTAAMPDGTGLDKFARAFPERTFDVGICEQHGVAFASGMRLAGLKPVAAIYSTFLQRGYDQLVHDVAIQGNPVVFAMDRGGLVGDDGVTHQGLYDIAYQRCLPTLVLMSPKDAPELRAMLEWAVDAERIVAIRYPRATIPRDLDADGKARPIELGKGELLRGGWGGGGDGIPPRNEAEVAFFAYGALVENSLAASDLLKRDGIRASVYNARFAKPIDQDLLVQALESHDVVLTVEEHSRQGGFGSACVEAALERRPELASKLRILGVQDVFVHHGDRSLQLRDHGLDAEGLVRSAWQALGAGAGAGAGAKVERRAP